MSHVLTWQIIDSVAADLGAKYAARLKWRQRGIPPEWRIRIFEALRDRGREISFSAFDELRSAA